MSRVEVTTQKQLDSAIKGRKPGDVIVCLGGTLDRPLIVRGSSHVEAWGSSHVAAWGSSHVVARGSSSVEARGSSHVVAWGSSHVAAWGSSSVVAWESSRVVARESSSVEARGSSHVVASKFVPVQVHSKNVRVKGGVVISVPDLDTLTPAEWCDYYGV
ncbi:MAG: hypothetical protein NUW01_01650, partial [Gemmatimonadaceae bacterium]|nr:hypothetical protein [Gemmatimonadaceae bacterium]